MLITYDEKDLLSRSETLIRDEAGETLYRGIYDFSYKYRTRIYDARGEALAYVQLDITSDKPVVAFCDDADRILGCLQQEEDHYCVMPQGWILERRSDAALIEGIMTAERDHAEIVRAEDLFQCILILFALVEIGRKEE